MMTKTKTKHALVILGLCAPLVVLLACGGVEPGELEEVETLTEAVKVWPDCSLVRCPGPSICQPGEKWVPASGKQCCGKCVGKPTGQCVTPKDCEGLVHIMCVGSWTCENYTCAYVCDGVAVPL